MKPTITLVICAQRDKDMAAAPITWNTLSAGVVHIEFDVTTPSPGTVDLTIQHDGRRAFVRGTGYTPDTVSSCITTNQTSSGAYLGAYDNTPHCSVATTTSPTRVKLDVDLKHFAFGGPTYDNHSGTVVITISAHVRGAADTPTVLTASVPYECRDPYDFTITFDSATYDYSQGTFKVLQRAAKLHDASNNELFSGAGFQYTIGLEDGLNNKIWTPVTLSNTVTLPDTCRDRCNTIFFRVLDRYGNAATTTLFKPWDTDQPVLSPGKLCPQNGITPALDIQSGNPYIYMYYPWYREHTPRTWGIKYTVDGVTHEGTWISQAADYVPLGNHAVETMSQWYPFASGWAPVWHGLAARDLTTTTPAPDNHGWVVWADDYVGWNTCTSEMAVDAELGVSVVHAVGAPRIVLTSPDVCMIPDLYDYVPLRTCWAGRTQNADHVRITLKVDSGRGANGYTQDQPTAPPTWRCRFAWRHAGEEELDGTFQHWTDFCVYDDGRWHTYDIDMSGVEDWMGTALGYKEQFYIVFGSNIEREQYKQHPDDDQTVFFKYMIRNQDTTNPSAAVMPCNVWLAHFAVTVGLDDQPTGFYTPVALSTPLDGDDSVYIQATLTDWAGRHAETPLDADNLYYVVPATPGVVGVEHCKTTDGLLRARIVGIVTNEQATAVEYSIEYRIAHANDDVWQPYTDGWQPVTADGHICWYTAARWVGYQVPGIKEGKRYFFRARGRHPRNANCVSPYGQQSDWFSDYITPQIIGCSHFTDAVHLYRDRTYGAPGDADGRAATWQPADVGAALLPSYVQPYGYDDVALNGGAWIGNANGRFYKSDWHDGAFYGTNIQPSTEPAWWCHIRNYAGCYTGDAYRMDGGAYQPNHPVDGYCYKLTWGESTRDTIPDVTDALITATPIPGYPLLQITSTLAPPVVPAIGYMHIRPCYYDGIYKPYDARYTVHLAIYADRDDGLHPAGAGVHMTQAVGIDGSWDDPDLDGNIYRLRAQATPVMGVRSQVERQLYHSYRLRVRPSGVPDATQGDWSLYYPYDPQNPYQQTDVVVGGLAENTCYEFAFDVRSSAGITGPISDTWGSPTYTNLRPVPTIINIYPSGAYTHFMFEGLGPRDLGNPATGTGYYEVWDWMRGVSVGTIPARGEGLYDAGFAIEGGLQGGYIIKSYNNSGMTLPDYDTDAAWADKPITRQPDGWKPAIYDYVTMPRVADVDILIGYDIDASGVSVKYLKAQPARGINQDAQNRFIYYNPTSHPYLSVAQRTLTSNRYHQQTQYLTEVWSRPSPSGTPVMLGYARGDGTPGAYNETCWATMDQIRSSDYKSMIAPTTGGQYGFRMRARQRIAPGTGPTGDTEDDALESGWWTVSPWSAVTWGGAIHSGDYTDLLHMYVRTTGIQLWDSACVMQDINPSNTPSIFKDIRVSYRIVGSETTDLDNYPATVAGWIREQWQQQQSYDPAWWTLRTIPESMVRVMAEVTFVDKTNTPRTIQRIVNLWDSEAKHGHHFTGWGVHNEQKADLVSIHSDYGACRFDTYAPQVAAASGWISQQRTDTWYYMRWNLYDDVATGLETVGCPGSLSAYGATWTDVTNVRLSLWVMAMHTDGIYTDAIQPEAMAWRGQAAAYEPGSCGVLVRDFSVGWTSQVDRFNTPVYSSDAWSGAYEWDVVPMNIIHNPKLDTYAAALQDPNHLPIARPPEFLYKKTMPAPANIYNYDDYVRDLVED